MPWYDRTWDSLGWSLDPVARFYTVNTDRFASRDDALPPECAAAMAAAGWANPVDYPNRDVVWSLAGVTAANVVTQGPRELDGSTTTRTGNCVEHGLWPLVSDHSIDGHARLVEGDFFGVMRNVRTLVIYATLAPCLRCCNALIGLSLEARINIIVRCQEDYDFLGVRTAYDMTIVIPRRTTLTSVRNPAPTDRCIFLLHDSAMDFSERRVAAYKGAIRPMEFLCSPHRSTWAGATQDDLDAAPDRIERRRLQRMETERQAALRRGATYGATCGGLKLSPTWGGTVAMPDRGLCETCGEEQAVSDRRGSGRPWQVGYEPDLLVRVR